MVFTHSDLIIVYKVKFKLLFMFRYMYYITQHTILLLKEHYYKVL